MTNDTFRGPTAFSVEGWMVLAHRGLPASFNYYRDHASHVEEYDLDTDEGDILFVAVGLADTSPSLVVAQRFTPCTGGFDPGVALVPSTRTVFLGAGERLLAYRLDGRPEQLWEDSTSMGFLRWSVHSRAVLMAAELELAAWDPAGTKLWSRFVEPPWGYTVTGDRITLDVMGAVSEFDILDGP